MRALNANVRFVEIDLDVSDHSAKRDRLGNLIVTRAEEGKAEHTIGTDVDPVMLEVFNNLFMSAAEQMGTCWPIPHIR